MTGVKLQSSLLPSFWMNRWNSQILVPQGLESLEKRKAIRNNQVTNDKVQIGPYLATLWANFFKLAPWFFFLLIYHWTENYTVDLTLKYFKWTFLHLAQNTWFAGTELSFHVVFMLHSLALVMRYKGGNDIDKWTHWGESWHTQMFTHSGGWVL